jgi:hypothetical protein
MKHDRSYSGWFHNRAAHLPSTISNVICPICKLSAKQLDKIGDWEGFDCPKHKRFKVAGSVLAVGTTAKRTPDEWEKALSRAKRRNPGQWPLIQSEDFDG